MAEKLKNIADMIIFFKIFTILRSPCNLVFFEIVNSLLSIKIVLLSFRTEQHVYSSVRSFNEEHWSRCYHCYICYLKYATVNTRQIIGLIGCICLSCYSRHLRKFARKYRVKTSLIWTILHLFFYLTTILNECYHCIWMFW